LPVQRDFNDGRQAKTDRGGQSVRVEDGDLALNQAGFAQPFDPAQAGGWGCVHPLSQSLVAQTGIVLQLGQQLNIHLI